MSGRLRIALLAVALAVGACTSESETTRTTAVAPPPPTTTSGPSDPLALAKQTVVSVDWAIEAEDGTIRLTGPGGSGSVVTPNGLILTNAHVAKPDAPGQAVLYLPPRRAAPELLVIRFVEQEDREPVARFLAEPVTVEGWYDLAVLRISETVETGVEGSLRRGSPVGSLDLPSIPVGDSDLVTAGSELVVLGFPGIGGSTLSVTGNRVSGFNDDEKLGPRGWIKTDSKIAPGNSGGMALVDGTLIGIPTRGPDDSDEGFNDLRPVNLAHQLIADAQAGQAYVRGTGVVFGTGRQAFDLATWSSGFQRETLCASDTVTDFPPGATRIVAVFEYAQLTPNEDILELWFRDDKVVNITPYVWDLDQQGACAPSWISNEDGLPAGTYEVRILAGENLRLAGSAQTRVGVERPQGISLTGKAVDGDSGAPIPGARIGFLEPGTDPEAWLAQPSADTVYSAGKTGANGEVTLSAPLVPGVEYPFVGLADGYKTISGCCFVVDPDATAEVTFTFVKAG